MLRFNRREIGGKFELNDVDEEDVAAEHLQPSRLSSDSLQLVWPHQALVPLLISRHIALKEATLGESQF